MISTHIVGQVLVINLEKKLDMQTSAPVQEKLLEYIADKPQQVLVSLVALEFVSSAGLRVILHAAKQVRAYKGTLKVSGAEGMVKEVLEISGFDSLLDLYDSEDQALASFS